ncbi:MAG: hypothetical protein LBB78_08820 [Spirochaetaceae bacterium]|jgi:hypothetical protein|nr:hypothetical protein [Spirochaetaceae bacterium]
MAEKLSDTLKGVGYTGGAGDLLGQDIKDALTKELNPLYISMGAVVGGALLSRGIAGLIAINYKSRTMAGDTEIHPTANATKLSKVETTATETEGKLAYDKVAGVNGEVKAQETEALAAAIEALAMESGASACRTKAGASDIETKALKMT